MVFPARQVGGSVEHDLALLKLDSHSDRPVAAEWATDDPQVGQIVAAVAHSRSRSAPLISVVATATQSEPPPLGDVAQFPYYFEKGPGGAAVIVDGEFHSAEQDVLREALQAGDIVTHLEGQPTATIEEFGQLLMRLLYQTGDDGKTFDTNQPARGNLAGEPLRVTVLRNGESKTLNVLRIHSAVHGPFWHLDPKSLRRDGFSEAFSIDARIRPDQCGGPVVDLDGRVVGITIARLDSSRTLVLPARVVRQVVDELRQP
jgi:S1-C subfamily serine protease